MFSRPAIQASGIVVCDRNSQAKANAFRIFQR